MAPYQENKCGGRSIVVHGDKWETIRDMTLPGTDKTQATTGHDVTTQTAQGWNGNEDGHDHGAVTNHLLSKCLKRKRERDLNNGHVRDSGDEEQSRTVWDSEAGFTRFKTLLNKPLTDVFPMKSQLDVKTVIVKLGESQHLISLQVCLFYLYVEWNMPRLANLRVQGAKLRKGCAAKAQFKNWCLKRSTFSLMTSYKQELFWPPSLSVAVKLLFYSDLHN